MKNHTLPSSRSSAKFQPINLKHVHLTNGFWLERYRINRKNSLQVLWDRAVHPKQGHVIQNFEIAGGKRKGDFKGTLWQDAWLYKWIEAGCYILASDPDARFNNKPLSQHMDEQIELIAAAQEKDGYLATQITANPELKRFEAIQNHELYTMGHMITAACVHYKITGKRNFLEIAVKNR